MGGEERSSLSDVLLIQTHTHTHTHTYTHMHTHAHTHTFQLGNPGQRAQKPFKKDNIFF